MISLILYHRTSFLLNWVRCKATQFAMVATNQTK